jgi:hypothetical protein
MDETEPFYDAFRGRFSGVLSWDDLGAFWHTVRRRAATGWYIYAIGLPAPAEPSGAADVVKFIDEVDALLRRDHREDYCGIVYVDSKDDPAFIKIFDPHNLGVSCGFSKNPPLPGWIMSRTPPAPLPDKAAAARQPRALVAGPLGVRSQG